MSELMHPPIYLQRLSKEVQSALARASSTAEETISAMKTVRSFANEDQEAEAFSRRLQQVYALNRKEAAAYTCYVWGSGVRGQGSGVHSRGLQGAIRYGGGEPACGWGTSLGCPQQIPNHEGVS